MPPQWKIPARRSDRSGQRGVAVFGTPPADPPRDAVDALDTWLREVRRAS